MNKVWTIAGSDNSGGAGIQADIKTFHDFNVHPETIITAVTAQNPKTVDDIFYLPEFSINKQINSLTPPKVIKLGMQGETKPVIDFLKNYNGFVIADPVMAATSGAEFSWKNELLPFIDLITPNIMEAEKLAEQRINNYSDMKNAAEKIRQLGPKQVYLKGGHLFDVQFCQDYYTNGAESFWLSSPKINNPNTHGSGCTLSAAIAANLANGYCLKDALVIAKMYINQGIRLAIDSVQQKGFPDQMQDLAYLSSEPLQNNPKAFPSCGPEKLGLYPIVESSDWIKKVAEAGVTTAQLRIKTSNPQSEIIKSIEIARKYSIRLFINDHWELAIKHQAYGVHLGQEDIESANLNAIKQAGLRLGISTHCFYEVARAHTIRPSYIACGPIYPTTTKDMPWKPQGLKQLSYWCQLLDYPVVAIGGINQERLNGIYAAGADAAAMISALPNCIIKDLTPKFSDFY